MLESVPRYDADRISPVGDRAVVVGGSMAGLLAARVLADAFEEVVVIERDELPDGPVPRRGVPQGRHPHVLQEAGRSTLEDLFPGFGEDLLSAGGLLVDSATEFQFYMEGDFLAEAPTRLPMYCASRPLFEETTRRRLAAFDGVAVRGSCQFVEYDVDDDASAVQGVVVRNEDDVEETIGAQLVADATGRTSRTPAWLEDNGFRSPPTDEVYVDVAYSTAVFERPEDERRSLMMLPDPPRTRGAALFPVEGGRWLFTLFGVHGDHPPTTIGDFADFAASLPTPEFGTLVDEHGPVSEEVHCYPFPTEVRHRYEDLDRFPSGLVVIGDAVASFNPFYGQGISVAALEALQLHHVLAAGRVDLARRFFERAEGVVDDAWTLAVGADFAFAETTGPKPRGTDLVNRYLARLTRKAHSDGALAEAFARVITMERRPASLFRPGIAWRVLRPTALDDELTDSAKTGGPVDGSREGDATASTP